MSNISTAIRYVQGRRSDPNVVDLSDEFRRADNAAFLAHVARELRILSDRRRPGGTRIASDGIGCIGLVGEYGLFGYRTRTAEELLRVDGTPSHWSQAFLFASPLCVDAAENRSATRSPWLWESSLEPAPRFVHVTNRLGVAPRRFADYARSSHGWLVPHCIPNLAVIAIALTDDERQAVLRRADDPNVDQMHYDIPALRGEWFAYLNDRASEPNPIAQGRAHYSTAYLQLAYDAAGIDLAVGSHQKNVTPEHLWQAVKYLRDGFKVADPETKQMVTRDVFAWSCVRDPHCVVAPRPIEIRTMTDVTMLASRPT